MDKDMSLLLIFGIGAFGLYYLNSVSANKQQCYAQQAESVSASVIAPAAAVSSRIKEIVSIAVNRFSQPHSFGVPVVMQQPINNKLGFNANRALGFTNGQYSNFQHSANNFFI